MASESLICLRSGRLPVASVFQVSVLSAFPAPGVGCISGFRPCLFLRFPVLAASPVFILSVSAVFSLPAPPVPGVVRFSGFHLSASAVFSLTCSSGSRICPALRLDALFRQPFVSPLPPPFVTQPAARRLSPENLPSPTAPGCASSPLRGVSHRPRTGSGSRGCCRRCRGRRGLSARMSSAAARGSR